MVMWIKIYMCGPCGWKNAVICIIQSCYDIKLIPVLLIVVAILVKGNWKYVDPFEFDKRLHVNFWKSNSHFNILNVLINRWTIHVYNPCKLIIGEKWIFLPCHFHSVRIRTFVLLSYVTGSKKGQSITAI